jgi:hypothetical protein
MWAPGRKTLERQYHESNLPTSSRGAIEYPPLAFKTRAAQINTLKPVRGVMDPEIQEPGPA